MAERTTRRLVDDAEFSAAWDDEDNRNLIAHETRKYGFDGDERERLGMMALWRALQYHNPQHESGQRFTTSLYRFLHWELRRESARIAADQRKRLAVDIDEVDESHLPCWNERRRHDYGHEGRLLTEQVKEHLAKLPGWMRKILREYYLEGRSMGELAKLHGYSKETARFKVKRAVARLQELCVEAPIGPSRGVVSDADSTPF